MAGDNTYFVGMRDSFDVVEDEDVSSWRRNVRMLWPNGSVAITGLTAMMPTMKIGNCVHNWWEEHMPTQTLTVSGVYDSVTEDAYTKAADPGGFTHVWKVAKTGLNMFRKGQLVQMGDKDNRKVEMVGRISDVHEQAAHAYISTRSLHTAPYVANGISLSDVDIMMIIGNSNAQGAARPEAVSRSPSHRDQRTTIVRNPLDMSRTRMQTETYRTGKPYKKEKKNALWQHSVELEKSLLWSRLSDYADPETGNRITTMRGIIPDIDEHGITSNFFLDDAWNGQTWKSGGNDYINAELEKVFRFGSKERFALCGNGAIMGVQQVAEAMGHINIRPMQTSWGMKVMEWTTPFGVVTLHSHPLFIYYPGYFNTMVLFEPANMKYAYMQDTKFCPDNSYGKGGNSGIDGKQEEWLTEAAIEFSFPDTGGILDGIGKDNPA